MVKVGDRIKIKLTTEEKKCLEKYNVVSNEEIQKSYENGARALTSALKK